MDGWIDAQHEGDEKKSLRRNMSSNNNKKNIFYLGTFSSPKHITEKIILQLDVGCVSVVTQFFVPCFLFSLTLSLFAADAAAAVCMWKISFRFFSSFLTCYL